MEQALWRQFHSNFGVKITPLFLLCVPPYIALYIPCDEVITMHIERLVCILAAAIFAIGCRVG